MPRLAARHDFIDNDLRGGIIAQNPAEKEWSGGSVKRLNKHPECVTHPWDLSISEFEHFQKD